MANFGKMNTFIQVISEVGSLMSGPDPDLLEIVVLSLRVSLTATFLACLVGLPLGAVLGIRDFRGKAAVTILINTLMGMPPVVLGLIVYLLLSRSGPMGFLQLLYTPTAMIVAQFALVLPIVTALTRQIIEDSWSEYRDTMQSLCVPIRDCIKTLLWDRKISLLTAGLAGFSRAISEVGAVIIVGGNIDHLTRVMTTAIALETSRGNLPLALALGVILLTIALIVNTLVFSSRARFV